MLHYPTTLEFIEERDDFAVYEDAEGVEHFMNEDGEFVEPTTCEDCESLTLNPSMVDGHRVVCESCYDDDYVGCSDCSATVHNDDVTSINGDPVCDRCRDDNYGTCWDCSAWNHRDDLRYVAAVDTSVCDGCVEERYTCCDNCEEYYRDGSPCCSDGCDCEAPAQRFAMRNGDALLGNDERTLVSLAAGHLSDEGVGEVSRLIRTYAISIKPVDAYVKDEHGDYLSPRQFTPEWEAYQHVMNLSYRVGDIGMEWQTKDGNYTRRLSKFAYKEFGGTKLPNTLISEVGNIGRAHSSGSDLAVEITRNLNLPREEFANEDSCWWTDYAASRCALKSNGGFGLRSFSEEEVDVWDYVDGPWAIGLRQFAPTGQKRTVTHVSGRAWVMPLRRTESGTLTPTIETEDPDVFVVFNGYGDLSGYVGARVIAQMTGTTYRKITFSSSPMYVNSEAGYLVGPEEVVASFTDGELNLYLDDHANLTREYAHA